jgi:peptidoglycan-associated lipoprotein
MRVSKMLCVWVFMVLVVSFAMPGCSKKPKDAAADLDGITSTMEAAGEGLGPEESLSASFDDGYNYGSGVGAEGPFSEARTSAPLLPIYFDFDSSRVRRDQVERIEHNGDYLRENPNVRVRIEGNCDSRGTKEYNLALGERRAQAAKSYLINLGISQNRLSTVSWGAEKPLTYGQDEYSWAQNRRNDFIIVQ